MEIFRRVEALQLPLGEYVVFGSGPLEAHGIRSTGDVALFVTTVFYRELEATGWEERSRDHIPGGCLTKDGIYEAYDTWRYGDYNPAPEEIIREADIIMGLPFAPLREVLAWKRAFGRPKDEADIALIEEYLRNH